MATARAQDTVSVTIGNANPRQEDFASLLSSVLETVAAKIGRGATTGVDTSMLEGASADVCPDGEEWVNRFKKCREMPTEKLACSDG